MSSVEQTVASVHDYWFGPENLKSVPRLQTRLWFHANAIVDNEMKEKFESVRGIVYVVLTCAHPPLVL